MKKKLILILTNLVLTVGAISLVLVNGKYETDYVKAKDEPYTLNLSNLSSSNTTLITSNGNSIEFEVSGYSDGTFSNNSYIRNTTPINGIESLTISFETLNSDLTISYGWYDNDYYVTDGVINSNNLAYTFNNQYPSYFKLENESGGEIDVTSIQLEYSCSESATPEAYSNVKYTLSSDGQSYSASRLNTSITSAIVLSEYNGKPVTSISDYAFQDCSSLTLVVIPNGVTSIGKYAFDYCFSLTSITIPNGVTSIGRCAFSYCFSLTSITIPDSITLIGASAFGSCSSLQYNEYDNAYYLGNSSNPYVVLTKAKDRSITLCKINENCRVIGSYAFQYCSSIRTIDIPDSITSIGDSAFYGCDSLFTIVIPNGVTSIGDSAFRCCPLLSSLTLGNSIISIGEYAFEKCSSLGSSLTRVVIPNSVASIGRYAFSNCSLVLTIYCRAKSKPSGWSSDWNYSDDNGYYVSVVWNYTA